MRKRKQKNTKQETIKIPKAPDPILSTRPNSSSVRQLGKSALKNSTPQASIAETLELSQAHKSTDHTSSALNRIASQTSFNVNSIQSYPELIAALEAKAIQITLGANIVAPTDILINHDVAINFNGYNIISEETNPGAHVFDIRSGEVTLTGKGKIFAMGARSVAIRAFGAISIGMPAYTTLTIDEEISLFAPDSYGILISPNLGVAYGLTINLSGEIIAHDGIGLSSRIRGRDRNLPTINIKSGARITVDEDYGSALEAAGYAVWNIGAAKLTGATGAFLKTGQINFSHAEVIATGLAHAQILPETLSETTEEALIADEPILLHAAIHVADTSKHDLAVAIEGGTYLGEKSYAIAGSPSSLESFVIKGGDFSGALDVLHHAIEADLDIEEGSFSLHPALHLKALKPEIVLLPEPKLEPNPELKLESKLEPSSELKPEPEPEPQTASKPELELEPQPTIELKPAPELISQLALQPTPEPTPALEELPVLTILPKPQPLPLPPTYDEVECAEKIAMQKALADAISEMKSLKASDYEVGFGDLQDAIHAAEQLLTQKIITLAAIRDAAGNLLSAFDNLEERDEFSLTDDELDQLFYHGAILDELAAEESLISDPLQPSTFEPSQPFVSSQSTIPTTTPNPTPETPLDFSVLTAIISQISALNPSDYTADTYNILLSELTQVKAILPSATQSQINLAVQNLSTHLANLARVEAPRSPVPQPTIHSTTPRPTIQIAPQQPTTYTVKTPRAFVDEMVPTRHWSTGVTAIDETDPRLNLAEDSLKNPHKKLGRVFAPFANLSKSISVGFHAGLVSYRKTRQTSKPYSSSTPRLSSPPPRVSANAPRLNSIRFR